MNEVLNFIYLFIMYTIEIIGSIILLLLGLTGYGNKQAEKILIFILTEICNNMILCIFGLIGIMLAFIGLSELL